MDESRYDSPELPPHTQPSLTLRAAAGVLLLLLGVMVCVGVLVQLGLLVNAEAPPSIVRLVTPEEGRSFTIGSPRDSFTLAPEVFIVAGYIVMVMLLSLMVSIAKVLITAGTNLLEPSPRKLLKELIARIRDGAKDHPQ